MRVQTALAREASRLRPETSSACGPPVQSPAPEPAPPEATEDVAIEVGEDQQPTPMDVTERLVSTEGTSIFRPESKPRARSGGLSVKPRRGKRTLQETDDSHQSRLAPPAPPAPPPSPELVPQEEQAGVEAKAESEDDGNGNGSENQPKGDEEEGIVEEEEGGGERGEADGEEGVVPPASGRCTTCGETAATAEALVRHAADCHGERRCPVCDKLFQNKFSLRSHADVHAERRNFCCHVCGRLFRTASCLCNHVRAQHTDPPPAFECPHCSKMFTQRCHLSMHMRSHTGERPFVCGECGQRFTSRCQLRRHENGRHLRLERFPCAQCGRAFRYASNYKAHLSQHDASLEVTCDDCGRAFRSANSLLRHRRLHTGDKPFPCGVCGKRFADCSNRRRHMESHNAPPRPPRAPRSKRQQQQEKQQQQQEMQQQQQQQEKQKQQLEQQEQPPPPLSPQQLFPQSDIVTTFSSLRDFLESSEVAEALEGVGMEGASETDNDSSLTAGLETGAELAVEEGLGMEIGLAAEGSEIMTLLAASDSGLQQVFLLPAGLLDALDGETVSTLAPLSTPALAPTSTSPFTSSSTTSSSTTSSTSSTSSFIPVPTPPPPATALVDKEAIIRMLNSQGTTIA